MVLPQSFLEVEDALNYYELHKKISKKGYMYQRGGDMEVIIIVLVIAYEILIRPLDLEKKIFQAPGNDLDCLSRKSIDLLCLNSAKYDANGFRILLC